MTESLFPSPVTSTPVVPEQTVRHSSRATLIVSLALVVSLGGLAFLAYQNMLLQQKIQLLEVAALAPEFGNQEPQNVLQGSLPKRLAMPSFALNGSGEDAGKAIFLMIPESWQEVANPGASPELTTDRQYTILTPESESSRGDFTLGRADFYVRTGSSMELGFSSDLDSVESKKVQVAGLEAEQRQGFGGIGGSVFVKETKFITSGGTMVLLSLVTQDMNMLNDLEPQYDQLLETAKVE